MGASFIATNGFQRGDGDRDDIDINLALDEVQEVRASASASLGAPLLSLPKGMSIILHYHVVLENILLRLNDDLRQRARYRAGHRSYNLIL